MVRLTRIYTRGGDKGRTSLGDGTRVAKHETRIEALGSVDEANAVLGVARLHVQTRTAEILADIQNDLFDLGADLCKPGGEEREGLSVSQAHIERLESQIDAANDKLAPLHSFILPGGSAGAAHLHWARTVVRRAERIVSSLGEAETTNPAILKYLNRLSDLLFVLARTDNENGARDVLWRPGANT